MPMIHIISKKNRCNSMGFLDKLLKAKWQDDDPQVRIEAVKKLNDVKLLERIARNDESEDVRVAALENIHVNSILMDIAKNDFPCKVRAAAVGNIDDDDEFLIETVKSDDCIDVRRAAISRIGIKNGRYSKSYLRDRVDDKLVLAEIAKDSSFYENDRDSAIERIDDASLLEDIAKNALDFKFRKKAILKIGINKIADEQIIADVAINYISSKSIRIFAINKIRDVSLLEEIAKNTDGEIRNHAINNAEFLSELGGDVGDEQALVKVAKSSEPSSICKGAVNMIDDDAVLADIAVNADHEDVRIHAVEKIYDDSILEDIAKDLSNSNVSCLAVEKIYNKSILEDLAKNSPDVDVRRIAVEGIKDENVLAEIAKNDSDSRVCCAAVKNIINEPILDGILKSTSYDNVKREILKNRLYSDSSYDGTLKNYSLISHIPDLNQQISAFRALNGSRNVRIDAIKYLNDVKVLKYIAKNDGDYVFWKIGNRKRYPVRSEAITKLMELGEEDYVKSSRLCPSCGNAKMVDGECRECGRVL